MDPLPTLDDDGLYTPEVGEWAERRYRLISCYAEMFATSMKAKWASRVYIDLFAGAGRGRIKGTSRVVATSALLALGVCDPFDHYVFCDIDPQCIHALGNRVEREYPDRDARYVTGDANQLVDSVLQEIPRGRRSAGVLSFCVLDPFNLSDLKFSTLERLSSIFVDFLVLIPFENGDYVQRVRDLQRTPAAVRFVSLEPLLGPIPRLPLAGVDWVIVGGESGPGARPMEPEWVRTIRDRCLARGVPFFFKQWGGVWKKRTGRRLDGRTWDERPRRPKG